MVLRALHRSPIAEAGGERLGSAGLLDLRGAVARLSPSAGGAGSVPGASCRAVTRAVVGTAPQLRLHSTGLVGATGKVGPLGTRLHPACLGGDLSHLATCFGATLVDPLAIQPVVHRAGQLPVLPHVPGSPETALPRVGGEQACLSRQPRMITIQFSRERPLPFTPRERGPEIGGSGRYIGGRGSGSLIRRRPGAVPGGGAGSVRTRRWIRPRAAEAQRRWPAARCAAARRGG